MTTLPVVDLRDDLNAVSQLKDACESVGFFYLCNHGLTEVQSALAASEAFFSLPDPVKRLSLCNEANLGYTSFQDETVCPDSQSCGDTKEGYYITNEDADVVNPEHKNVWPTHPSLGDWKSIMLRYHEECTSLSTKLMQLLTAALDLPVEVLESHCTNPTAILRLIKYGRQPSCPSEGVFGTGPHSDYGFLTILATNGVPGLEIYYDGKWSAVPPPDANYLIVNLGDCLQRMTNNKFRSTVHRVVIDSSERDRYSMAFFYEPNRCALVECMPQFISDENPASYDPVLYGDYLQYKYNLTHTDFKKDSI